MWLDLDDPSRIIRVQKAPALTAELDWERCGYYPNVLYRCGAAELNGQYLVYYGAADCVLAVATVPAADCRLTQSAVAGRAGREQRMHLAEGLNGLGLFRGASLVAAGLVIVFQIVTFIMPRPSRRLLIAGLVVGEAAIIGMILWIVVLGLEEILAVLGAALIVLSAMNLIRLGLRQQEPGAGGDV